MFAPVSARRLRFATAFVIAMACAAAAVLACGPFLTELVTVTTIDPPDAERFARGDLGVVRPHFRRRNLLQAYRVLSGRPPFREQRAVQAGASSPVDEWFQIAGGRPAGFSQERSVQYYASFRNCTDDAFSNAVATYRARAARFGATSSDVRDWLSGQKAVFGNCGVDTLTIPSSAPAGVDRVIHADRAYQIAAAYFYARDYGEAEKRFRAIALDALSPWRPYGRFLAARTIIRDVTTNHVDPGPGDERAPLSAQERARFQAAEQDLQSVLADPAAAVLHRSARGLLGFLAVRLRPIPRLHELTARLSRDPAVDPQDVIDYVWLMDRFVGDTVEFHAADGAALSTGDDYTAWVLAMQDTAPDLDQALAAWRARRSPAWLVALLWRIPPGHAVAPELLQAAASLDHASSAYPTVAFLRVRLLMQQGRGDEARGVLATLPEKSDARTTPETINLLRAQRMRLARSLDEFLSSAPREFVVDLRENWQGKRVDPQPVFDEDAASVLSAQLPLDVLVDAAESQRLPPRLRTRVASAAFARAVVLNDDALALRVAIALTALAPPLARDLKAFADATSSAARHRAGIMTLLRTPGLHLYVQGLDDDRTIALAEPHRAFDHTFRQNWWCELASHPPYNAPRPTESMRVVDVDRAAAPVTFLSDEQRQRAAIERQALAASGAARAYLSTEALAWARDEPRNPDVAEALAHVVEGWRWGCGDDPKWTLAKQAFDTLHQVFPQSDWARRTRYWYRD